MTYQYEWTPLRSGGGQALLLRRPPRGASVWRAVMRLPLFPRASPAPEMRGHRSVSGWWGIRGMDQALQRASFEAIQQFVQHHRRGDIDAYLHLGDMAYTVGEG